MRIKNKFTAFLLVWKRLLKKTGFVILLCLIPLLAWAFSHFASTEESGILRIALASADGDSLAVSVMESLESADGLVLYSVYPTSDEAVQSVYDGRSDGAWVFEADFSEGIRAVALGESRALVSAYLSEDSVVQKMAREEVNSKLYPQISGIMHEEFCFDDLFLGNVTKEEVDEAYLENSLSEALVTFRFESSAADVEEMNYLTAPLRGVTCVLALMCGFCGALYFLSDERGGVYGFVSSAGRFFILLLTVGAALTMAVVVMVASVLFCGSGDDLLWEAGLACLYAASCMGFCTSLAVIVRNENYFAVMTVVMLAASLVLSPVFLDLSAVKWLQVLFPSYHYLYAVETSDAVNMALYSAISLGAALLLGIVFGAREGYKSAFGKSK